MSQHLSAPKTNAHPAGEAAMLQKHQRARRTANIDLSADRSASGENAHTGR